MELPAWLFVVDVTVDPAVEEAWNRWYDSEHLPEIVGCPGFLSAARYVSDDADTRRYITVYDVTAPDALTTDEFTERRGWREFQPHVQAQTRLYRRIASRSNAAQTGSTQT